MMYLRGLGAKSRKEPLTFLPLKMRSSTISGVRGLGDDSSSRVTAGLTILALLGFGWVALKIVGAGKKRA